MSLFLANLGLLARAPGGGGGFDPDAEAYFTAAGITDAAMKTDANQFYLDAKADGYYSDLDPAFYLFLGGDATKHSYNGFNPSNFQITWSGSPTHDSNGVTGTGSSVNGSTGINASTHLIEDSTHLAVYSRSSGSSSNPDIGCAATDRINLACSLGGSAITEHYGVFIVGSPPNGLGLFVCTRRSNTDLQLYRHGSSLGTNTSADGGSLPNAVIGLCGSTGQGGSNRNIAFASVGKGLTTTKVGNLTSAVEALQDARGRGVI